MSIQPLLPNKQLPGTSEEELWTWLESNPPEEVSNRHEEATDRSKPGRIRWLFTCCVSLQGSSSRPSDK
ncbi:MAG: hypothetical protein SP1CHLAM54_15590 [Chlamydiia bacterium]|nr:hypothetical protein [Chlamydiia bacterium]MCH9616449.1 hypothetical protein [Chlamydiia bacterium]MCH9629565.1 hypothetical protein [Chlamydiia bacterium]